MNPARLDWIRFLEKSIIREVADACGDDVIANTLAETLEKAVDKNKRQFVWICDEWESFFREQVDDPNARGKYRGLLRSLFKVPDARAKVFAAAYMTGILPMIKMKGESAIPEFGNYTMFYPKELASYIGFTEEGVKGLLRRNPGCWITYEDMAELYEGYAFPAVGH